MKNLLKHLLGLCQSSPMVFFTLWSSLAVLLVSVNGAAAVDSADTSPASPPAAQPEKSKPFEYILENRVDPFMPFITEKAASQSTEDMNEIVDTNETLTGMQIFEPGQLSLVALVEKEGEKMAMVQDFTGKGYVITEGTKIGKRGVVKEIASNKVLIEETAQTRAGKKIITHIDMVLKKEGEE